MTSSERLLVKFALALRHVMQTQGLRVEDIDVPRATLHRALNGKTTRLTSFARLFEACGADVDIVVTIRGLNGK